MSNLGTSDGSWSPTRFIDVAEQIMDYRGRTPRKLGMDWGNGTIPAISARNVRMGLIDFLQDFYVGSEALYRRWMTHGDMERGDILITTEAPLGNVAAVPDSRRYILSQRTILIRPRADLFDRTYVLKFLQSPAFQRLLSENATGSTALGIRRKRLEQLAVWAPDLENQRRIGKALQDIDDLISMLERLIAKKQAIKQGMIQQLLTGKTRLPGFSDPWDVRRLVDIAKIRTGTPKARAGSGGRYWIVDMGSVTRDGSFVVSKKTNSSVDLLRAGELIMPKDDIGGGNIIGRTGRIDKDNTYVLADHVYALTPVDVDSEFLNYAINSYTVNASLRAQATGSAQLGLSKVNVQGQEVKIPGKEEQKAISRVLLDIDSEIRALNHKLCKFRLLKQGMMQELLTGRTFLPVTKTAS